MNNSVFGKTMEIVRKRINCEVVTDIKRRDKLVSSPYFEQSIIINENVEVIKSKRAKVELKKPIYCGFATLKLSKLLMNEFHYNIIKKQYGEREKLLFTDTDSLCYEIEAEDVYDMYKNKALYDFSDYSENHEYYTKNNLKIDKPIKNLLENSKMKLMASL